LWKEEVEEVEEGMEQITVFKNYELFLWLTLLLIILILAMGCLHKFAIKNFRSGGIPTKSASTHRR
jgi:hypothetical protein